MPYIAQRTIKVQNSEGKIVIRNRGDDVPEADDFPNPEVWVRRGYIKPADVETGLASGYYRDKIKPMRAATDADAARGAGTAAPKPGEPLPESSRTGLPSLKEIMDAGYEERAARAILAREGVLAAGGSEDDADAAGQKAAADFDATRGDAPIGLLDDAGDDAGGESDDDTMAELMKLKREDLDKLATDHGVADAESFPNKTELAKAVLKIAG